MIGVRSMLLEARELVQTIQNGTAPAHTGPVVVSGMLCEQLARELGAGAEPGAVLVDGSSRLGGAEVLVHVMAAEPSRADDALVRAADAGGVPVVLVQLWPQEDWTPPFVLTPFVVECKAGQGFPLPEIARRVAEAVEHPTDLARRLPVLQEVVAERLVGTSVLRAALIGVAGARLGASRPLLALEQVRMLSQLRSLQGGAGSEELPVVAGVAAAAVGISFALRGVARSARRSLPAPLANAAVAAGATWALAEAIRRLDVATS